jgi:hypothetical protein
VNQTTALDAAFEANPAARGQYMIYSITLGGGTFTSLAAGNAAVVLALQGPSLGVLGEGVGNAAGSISRA